MFITKAITTNEATGELKLLYRQIKKHIGFVPPHFELFATIDINALKEFMQYNLYFETHPKIDAAIMPMLRLAIAQKECRNYCINFNRQMLVSRGVNKQLLEDIGNNIYALAIEENQKLLLKKVLYALQNAEKFDTKDLEELYEVGFNDKDFYDLLAYASDFVARSKMIEVYIKSNK